MDANAWVALGALAASTIGGLMTVGWKLRQAATADRAEAHEERRVQSKELAVVERSIAAAAEMMTARNDAEIQFRKRVDVRFDAVDSSFVEARGVQRGIHDRLNQVERGLGRVEGVVLRNGGSGK